MVLTNFIGKSLPMIDQSNRNKFRGTLAFDENAGGTPRFVLRNLHRESESGTLFPMGTGFPLIPGEYVFDEKTETVLI